MRSSRQIAVVGCHAEGEIGDVIVGGVLPPQGASVFEMMRAFERDCDHIRRFLICEPRGSVARHVNLIVPPKRPDCVAGAIIMEPTEYPPMSGSNAMCVATVLLETGMVLMQEPEAKLRLDMPGGPVDVTARCEGGRVRSVTIRNVPCFADRLDAPLEVEGVGTIAVDVAYGGMFFALVDATALGFAIQPRRGARSRGARREGAPRRPRAIRRGPSRKPRHPRRLHRPVQRAVRRRRHGRQKHLHRLARALGPQPDGDRPLGAARGALRARAFEGRRGVLRISPSSARASTGGSRRRPFAAAARRSFRRSPGAPGSLA